MSSRSLALAALVFVVCWSGSGARGRDVFLTIGGGGAPAGNQVSLEKNALYFQRVLQALGLGDCRHDVLFSDGSDPGRDLQYVDPALSIPAANLLLAQLCGQEDGVRDQYRTNQVSEVRGPSSRAEIERWFDEARRELQPGDHLMIYFTGHGGQGDSPRTNFMHLWNGEKLTAHELAGLLDQIAPEVMVTLVMVQCYSGGFANLIFEEANSEKGPTAAKRCGFFATTSDRVAAGCTADIDEENYQEYSSYFFAALSGQKRLGETIQRPDYDGDGHTSFAEAHAYALLTSETIDVSVRTSDAFLRAFSKTHVDGRSDLMTLDGEWSQLLAAASAVDRAVLVGLHEQLDLGEQPVARARELLEALKKEKGQVEKRKGRKAAEMKKLADEIHKALKFRWPELANPWHPQMHAILTFEGAALVEAIQSHPRYSELVDLQEQVNVMKQQALDLQRRAAKCQRFVNMIERVALEANLSKLASPEILGRYRDLLASEAATLEIPSTQPAGAH
jgi:hypothetical protein